MRTACVQASRWMSDGIEIRVSVNVSARQFEQGTVGESIAEALAASKLPARLLGVELTESIMLDSSTSVRDTLMSLRESGVHVAVDDFGTGYASLRYVKHFPMDTVKIDREFVRGLPLDVHNAAITNSIVALARSLKLGVVAEGVETDAEQEFLRSLECEIVQGFLHARPLEAADFEAWFLSRKPRAVRSRPALAQAAEPFDQPT
jgi:EAL domain-containing protein (putative c-di-GMP-specific phosphodiesterase class I)